MGRNHELTATVTCDESMSTYHGVMHDCDFLHDLVLLITRGASMLVTQICTVSCLSALTFSCSLQPADVPVSLKTTGVRHCNAPMGCLTHRQISHVVEDLCMDIG